MGSFLQYGQIVDRSLHRLKHHRQIYLFLQQPIGITLVRLSQIRQRFQNNFKTNIYYLYELFALMSTSL